MAKELNDKQQAFCREYIIDLNATQAAIRAGYSEKTAQQISSENLLKPLIQEMIQKLIKERADRTGITADRVLNEYAKIAFIDIRKFYDEDGALKSPHDLEDDAAASLAGIDVDEIWGYDVKLDAKVKQGETKKIKMHNKIAALDSLAKHLGLFGKDNDQRKPEATIFYIPDDGRNKKY
jgi:phage terminase small subunit